MSNSLNHDSGVGGYEFLPFTTCAVDLLDEANNPIAELAIGMSAVLEIADYVKLGAEGSLSVKNEWACNYDIVFIGSNLKVFLEKYYPNRLTEDKISAIDDNKKYIVSSFDLS